MKISAQSYYGLKAVTFLAKESRVFSVKEIADGERIPYDYLEKIMQKLTRAGLVTSKRGSAGGYSLKRPSSKITAKDILTALDEAILPILCVMSNKSRSYCIMEKTCLSKNVWQRMQKAINYSLNSITLADLVYVNPKKSKR
ncbi:MAG: Rrf2 family transcriptional regulator [Candidatus Nealsonbacteria bacterium]|nr:Rrf2 family transcriptional regulator [Candidatus Nealsonbacteria bacterium]